MATGFATVKEVLSGDTVVLIGQPRDGPPPELRLTLSSLQAPRLGSRGRPDGSGEHKDDPFAWEAHEFLRRACIGKYVSFQVEYTIASISRQFGAVRLNTAESKENLCLTVARAGWARVKREPLNSKDKSCDYDEMLRLNEEAERLGLGMFSTDPAKIAASVRNMTWDVSDPAALLSNIKGQRLPAVVEFVRDGAALKLLLTDSMTYVNVNMAGVQCPRVNSGTSETAQPFALEARYFSEMRLLGRDVHVTLNGMDDRFNVFYGVVEHPAGDIAVEVVKNGLGRAADWSMQFTTLEQAAELRAAAQAAKEARLRIWKSYKAPKVSGDKQFEGVVSEALSGDTVMVRVGSPQAILDAPWACEERRITLSSVRAPRLGGRNNAGADQPYAEAAKEFVRARAIGKRCQVSVEYERSPSDGAGGKGGSSGARKFGTVVLQSRKGLQNLAELVVGEGLAEVLRHRADEERSSQYEKLALAQQQAKDAQRNIFADATRTPPPEPPRPLDLSANKELARANLMELKERRNELRGVIEYVHNGSRLRVTLPAENLSFNMGLGGIMCPQTARPGTRARAASKAEPWADEALAVAKSLALQREVGVELETVDRGGTAIGQLWVKRGGERVSLGVLLVQLGLAHVNEMSVKYTPICEELKREQEEARRRRLRLWEKWVEPTLDADDNVVGLAAQPGDPGFLSALELGKDGAAAGAAAAAAGAGGGRALPDRKLESMTAIVSEVSSGSVFFAQNQSAAAVAALENVAKEMAALAQQHGTKPGAPGTGLPDARRNAMCVALFNDGSGPAWYRARVLSVIRGGAQLHVRYIDFGNEATVDAGSVRPAAPGSASAPPLAVECALAFVKTPALDRDFGREAAMCLSDLSFNKRVTVRTHGRGEEHRSLVSVFVQEEAKEEAEQLCINEVLLREGLGYVDARQAKFNVRVAADQQLLQRLSEAQEQAHGNHVNLWRYGDPREDDE